MAWERVPCSPYYVCKWCGAIPVRGFDVSLFTLQSYPETSGWELAAARYCNEQRQKCQANE